jgi:O-antigen ligase
VDLAAPRTAATEGRGPTTGAGVATTTPAPAGAPAAAGASTPEGASAARPRLERRTAMVPLLVVGIASLPLLTPAGLPPGPGNTAIPDLVLIILLVAVGLWSAVTGGGLRWPYLLPTLLTVLAGGIAAMIANEGQVTLLKDIFVLGWAVAIANLGRDVRLLRVAFTAWAYIGTAYAAIMIVGYATGIAALSGQLLADDARATFTLGDANYASNYFICTLLVLRAAQLPRSPSLRYLCCALLIAAELLTGSNGGLLALVLAVFAGYVFRLLRTGRALTAVAAVSLAALASTGTVVAVGQIDVDATLAQVSRYSPLLRDSIGRADSSSAATRGAVLAETTRMLSRQEHPFGIGPGRTEAEMRNAQATYVREAHNDYIAAVLERGLLGGIAVIALVVVLAARCFQISRRNALTEPYARLVPRPELLGAMVLAMLVSGLYYETLHYRHGWALFGLIAALGLFGRREARA